MPPPKQPKDDDRGRVRIRFIEMEIDGSNQTLLEGIRNLTAAMPVRTVIKQVAARPTPQGLPDLGEGSTENGVLETELDDETETAPTETVDNVPARQRSLSPRKPKTAAKAPELATHLREKESPTFEHYCKEMSFHADAGDMERVLVIASWLKETRGLDSFGASEMYTLYRLMGWPVPVDITSPMRNLKKRGELSSAEAGKWSINLLGEKRVSKLRSNDT